MPVLQVKSLTVKDGGKLLIDSLSFTINKNQQWAIVGPSGSGKTTLMHTLSGKHSYSGSIVTDAQAMKVKIVSVEQQHRFRNLSNTNNFYYQQRFNSADSEDAITVEEDLQNSLAGCGPHDISDILRLLKLQHLLYSRLIQLSNGENKRLQIAKALLSRPDILLLDNPFIGLDASARNMLGALLESISQKDIILIMVTAYNQIPDFITHVLDLDKNKKIPAEDINTFRKRYSKVIHESSFTPDQELIKKLTGFSNDNNFECAVQMRNVTVQYNNHKIVDNINWEIRRGERWSLSGPNGSGKSTLLSLINADNPQAYSNEIYLFDRRRGTGESIWDIKRRIGFISPELHLYFDGSISCFDVIASGLFDTIGLFRMLNKEQEALVAGWMKLLNILYLKNKLLCQLSISQQRLVLLARALIKNPPMLILDEPCQGLDAGQIDFFKDLLNEICLETGKTLIYVSHYPDEIPDCVDRYFRL